jgi:hypothetical protein
MTAYICLDRFFATKQNANIKEKELPHDLFD